MGDNRSYQRQYHVLCLSAWRIGGRVRREKELERPPGNHAPIGLEPRLPLEPVEIAIQLGQEREREPHVHNRRGLAFWAARRLRGGRRSCAASLDVVGLCQKQSLMRLHNHWRAWHNHR